MMQKQINPPPAYKRPPAPPPPPPPPTRIFCGWCGPFIEGQPHNGFLCRLMGRNP